MLWVAGLGVRSSFRNLGKTSKLRLLPMKPSPSSRIDRMLLVCSSFYTSHRKQSTATIQSLDDPVGPCLSNTRLQWYRSPFRSFIQAQPLRNQSVHATVPGGLDGSAPFSMQDLCWCCLCPNSRVSAQTGGIDNPSRADLSLEAASGTDVSTATACTDTHMASRDSICWISVLSLRDFHGSLEVSFRRIKNSVSRLLNVVLFSFQMYILRNVLTNPNCIPRSTSARRDVLPPSNPLLYLLI